MTGKKILIGIPFLKFINCHPQWSAHSVGGNAGDTALNKSREFCINSSKQYLRVDLLLTFWNEMKKKMKRTYLVSVIIVALLLAVVLIPVFPPKAFEKNIEDAIEKSGRHVIKMVYQEKVIILMR